MKRIAPSPQLEVRDLEVVLSLASAGSTAKAAIALSITQSAVSRALCLAEEKLGVRLFERTARGLAPTAAGERLIEGAGAILTDLAALEARASAPAEAPTRVRIVCECYTAYHWLPSALARLRRKLPRLEVSLAVEHTSAPVDALESGAIDIALLTTATLPNQRRAALVEQPLFSDEVLFVVGTAHPLASRATLTRKDLCDFPLVTSHTPPAEARWFLTRVFGKNKPKLEFLRFPLTEAIIDAARAGMGIAVLSEWMASGYLEAGDLLPKRLSSGPLRRPWRIAYRREAAPAAQQLVGALEQLGAGVGPREPLGMSAAYLPLRTGDSS